MEPPRIPTLPVHECGGGLDHAFIEEPDGRIVLRFPGVFPCFVGVPELPLVEKANAFQVVSGILHGTAQ
jgi:hypothetical protein